MQSITVSGNFNISQLMDELIAQVPTFRRVTNRISDMDNGSVMGTSTAVQVLFANDIPPSLVDAVINAHIPTPRVHRDYAAELDAATDLASLKAVLRDYIKRNG